MITYIDTSVLLKLLVDDEVGCDAADRLWLESDVVVCAQIGYAEARAALATVHRNSRLTTTTFGVAKEELEALWSQLAVVAVSADLVRTAGTLAESEMLRGYDAVHLAASLASSSAVFASADNRLLAAAQRQGLSISNPLKTPD